MDWVRGWLFLNIWLLVPLIGTIWLAARRRRNPAFWGLFALLFSWLTLGVLALVSETTRTSEETAATLERHGAPGTALAFRPYPVDPPRARTLVLWLIGSFVVTGAVFASTMLSGPPHDPRLVTMVDDGPASYNTGNAQELVLSHRRDDGMTLESWSRLRMTRRCSRIDSDRIEFHTYVRSRTERAALFVVAMAYADPEPGTCNDHRFGAWPHAVAGIGSRDAQLVSLLPSGSVDEDDSEIPSSWLDEFEAGYDP